MPPSAAFVLGLLAGLGVGALVVAALVRATSRITGSAPKALPSLVLDGLRPAGRTDGIAAQRSLAKRLKRTSERTAAGKRVAATSLEVHVSPEDQAAIDGAMGIEAAEADLAEFYTTHANRSGWLLGAPVRLTIVRDISLRPRQAFVRAETRLDPAFAAAPARPEAEATSQDPPRPTVSARPATGAVPVAAAAHDGAAVTDVLPRAMLDEAGETRSYPVGLAEHAAAGDLLVVHGTDVRVVTASSGLATVGRAAHNDIVIDAPGVARDHLLLEHRQRAWWVVPGSAAVPATLDGRPVESATRIDGQGVVELGRGARLRLTVEPAR